MYLLKKREPTEREKRLAELKGDLRECEKLLKNCQAIYELTTDTNLIEARIYEMLSLAKHRDYLLCSIRDLCAEEKLEQVTR